MLEVYVKDGCPYCQKQLEDFKREGIGYNLYNVSADAEALKKARREYKADKVPLVIENGEVKSIGYKGMG